MGDGIDPQPRRLAPADATIEQVNVGGNLLEHRVERLVQHLEPGDLGIVQVDDHAAALGLIDPRLAQRVLQPLDLRRLVGRRLDPHRFLTSPHLASLPRRKLPSDGGKARAAIHRLRRGGFLLACAGGYIRPGLHAAPAVDLEALPVRMRLVGGETAPHWRRRWRSSQRALALNWARSSADRRP
jgi:hypothetical protein